jgi:hypothetical protein
MDYKKNNKMNTDREKGRGNKRARVTRPCLLNPTAITPFISSAALLLLRGHNIRCRSTSYITRAKAI